MRCEEMTNWCTRYLIQQMSDECVVRFETASNTINGEKVKHFAKFIHGNQTAIWLNMGLIVMLS